MNNRIDKITFRKIQPETLQILVNTPSLPEYTRFCSDESISRFKSILEENQVVPPILVSERITESGTKTYTIVDGLKRAKAAIEVKTPLLGCFIPFNSLDEEKSHFLSYQNSEKVDSNHLIVMDPTNEVNKEIIRINNLDTHPFFNKIFLGNGTKERDQVPAQKIKALIKKDGLEVEEIDDFTRLLSAFEITPRSIHLRPTALQGLVSAYKKIIIEGFQPTNSKHLEILSKYDWKRQKDRSSKLNKVNISIISNDITEFIKKELSL